MANPKAVKLEASKKQAEIILKLMKATHLEKHYIERATIIQLAIQSISNKQIADKIKIKRSTVMLWRNRWAENQAILDKTEKDNPKQLLNTIKTILEDAERSGRKSFFTQEQKARIVAISLQKPELLNLPISNWTLKDIAETSVKLGIVESISISQVGRFLKNKRHKTPSV